MNLCPFAQREWVRGSVKLLVCEATTESLLVTELESKLAQMQSDPSIETVLLIHPEVLGDFTDYNQFLSLADDLLEVMNLVGEIQIASFHPNYQFAGTTDDSAENYTNRSPYPMLHLLREASVERAVAAHPDPDGIPAQNIQLMQQMGHRAMADKLSLIRNHSIQADPD